MAPVMLDQDIIYVKRIKFSRLKINDIITVRKLNKVFTHRVVYKNKAYLVTKGDNNLYCDGKIIPKHLVGRVEQVERNGRLINPTDTYLIQSTLYWQEINNVIQEFEKEKIAYVILKGLPLHLYLEKTHPQRIYADCDLLVEKESFLKVNKIMKKFGNKNPGSESKSVENNYFKTINGFRVVFDIHLEPAFLMTKFSGLGALYSQKLTNQLTEELLHNKQIIDINNHKYFVLKTEYLIVYLTLHLFHHNFKGAFRYQFIDLIIKKKRAEHLDWNMIYSIINRYQLANFTYPVFALLKKHYQTPLPASLIKSIKTNLKQPIGLKNINIFDDEAPIDAGINRFFNIFSLSPNPLWEKTLIFFNPKVIYFSYLVLKKRLFSFWPFQKQVR